MDTSQLVFHCSRALLISFTESVKNFTILAIHYHLHKMHLVYVTFLHGLILLRGCKIMSEPTQQDNQKQYQSLLFPDVARDHESSSKRYQITQYFRIPLYI
ncbi:hypothetical protein vBKpnMM1_gp86c [Klebsiella phage vB_KpnM_M1]|uniref:Uncharacterized protein n=1 Tax=Klebsiella phage vB_KpnM_M1 TaxID=2798806 RepID=A0A7T8IWB5_9CAUD|nr:hypothetical protein vBKpnMM1_gp86c [Klebsiella phage vB_KpnM_M1]